MSDNGQKTEPARLSLLSAIPGAVGSCDETDKPAVHCSRPTLVNSRINRAIIKQRKWNIFKTVNDSFGMLEQTQKTLRWSYKHYKYYL